MRGARCEVRGARNEKLSSSKHIYVECKVGQFQNVYRRRRLRRRPRRRERYGLCAVHGKINI